MLSHDNPRSLADGDLIYKNNSKTRSWAIVPIILKAGFEGL